MTTTTGKGKKRSKAKKKTVRKDGSVRTTPGAAAKIKEIARRIYDRHAVKCRAAGYNKPSAKMAIDYLILCDCYAELYLSKEERENDNEYKRMMEQAGGK